MPHTSIRSIVFSLLVIGFSSLAVAQGGATGAITGTVQDPSGAVVANADVQITNQDTNVLERTVKSGADGTFVAPLLPVGTYTVVIQSSGFAEAKYADVVVRVTETTRMIAKLATKAVEQKIEVQAEVQEVDTTDATTGQAIESNTIRALPLATQNFQQLLTLSSGAQSELNAAAQLGRGDVRIEVNGQREDNNNYSIEGISATDYNVAELTNTPLPNPDVVQEFKVQTSLYDASQGRNGGGSINAILKSGTDKFHGDVYEFFRNTVFDANEFFLKQSGADRPVIQQNIFGGSLGGPLSPGAKLGFFFVNYSGTRQRSGESPGTLISTFVPYVPAADRGTAAAAEANLASDLNIASVDPLAASLLAYQSNQFGAPANGYLWPLPNNVPAGTTAGSLVPFTVSEPGQFTDNQFTTNWDRDFHDSRDRVSARFFFSNAEEKIPFGAGGLQASLGGAASSTDLNFPYDLPVHDRFLSVAETHSFSSKLVNDFRFGYVRINNSAINVNPVTADDVGIDRPTSNLTSSIYKFTFETSGFQFGPTPQANQYQIQNNYNFVDNLSWVHGAHTLTFGGQFVRANLNMQFPQVFNGQLFLTATNPSPGVNLTDFQNFAEGTPEFSFGGGGVYNHQYRQNDSAVFVQDDWKATRDLTLNLGLRTEFLGAWTDKDCHIGNIESSLTKSGTYPFIYPKCVNSLNVSGLTGNAAGSTFNNSTSTGFGPRVGFAWDVLGRHTTTIRGGYGIYYVREDVGAVDQLSFQSPFIPIVFFGQTPGFTMSDFFTGTPATNPNAVPQAGQLSAAWLPCLAQFTGFVDGNGNPTTDTTQTGTYNGCTGPGVNTTQNLFVLEVPRHFVVPNTQQWNLTVQRELGKQWVAEVGYVGTRGIHLRETRDGIQSVNATPQNPFTVTDTNGNSYQITSNTFDNAIARTPTPGLNGYSGYQIFANDAYSIYHALQATVSRRWGQGYFQAAYTFSKNIDATSTGNTAFNTAYNDQSNIRASQGISDFNRPQRLSVSYFYRLRFYEHSGLMHNVLGGWALSGVTVFQSGVPFSIFDSGAGTAFLGQGSTPLLGASLAPGATVASGLTSGSTGSRVANGYLNLSAFTPVPYLYYPNTPPGQCSTLNDSSGNTCVTGFGDLGRNIYKGPFEQNWDASILKYFKLTESQELRFTADFFNVWNHANFSAPVVTDVEAGASAFGRIVNTLGNPRLIQFSLRYAF
ncbi:MAG TPA: TonB-dependent receptor [Verrucomicrobiae bacterium]|nr:TonB-dependent receptor [Verrucomicrobiae bacterium]